MRTTGVERKIKVMREHHVAALASRGIVHPAPRYLDMIESYDTAVLKMRQLIEEIEWGQPCRP
jgi:hypothetical protein